MLKRWASWPSGIPWLVGIAAVVLAAAIAWALFVPLADWLARHDVGSAKPALLQTARDAARGRLLTLAAGLFAAGALVFTALNFTLSRHTFELTEQGQVTDRFTKAIEQLGSDKLDVRIGGVYALERVARDSAKDHPTVMEVLTAFIREHSREQWPRSDTGSPEQKRLTRPDVQAAVTVVGRRDAKRDIRRIDLNGAVLPGADLSFADLSSADLFRADLTDIYLFGADLSDASLIRANLVGANLFETNLTGAHLSSADLSDAHFNGADLSGANLEGANLTRADLGGTDLTGAHLTGAHLYGAVLIRAVLTRADFTRADLTHADLRDPQDLTDARWPEGAQVPEGWTVDSNSGLLKRAGQLSEVMRHYLW
jgi:uncharacterized protein YjbI with pentapeptide repeats